MMLNNKPKTVKELSKFGYTMTIVFLLICGLTYWNSHSIWMVFGTFSLIFLIFTLISPTLLRPVEKGWMAAARYISVVVTTLLLSIVYYLIVTPIGLVMEKIMGKDLLKLKWDENAKSYWEPVEKDGPGTRPYKPY